MSNKLALVDIVIGAVNIVLYASHPEWLHNLFVGIIAIAVGIAMARTE